VKLAMPGLQLCLRDGLDRADTFAGITVLSASEFLVGAGTIPELRKDGVIGLPLPTWLMPLGVIVEHLRRRAAENGIKLPKKLAPPASALPAWADENAAFGETRHRGARVTWSLNASQFSVACL
jgi:hypothetical protein